MSQSDTDPVHEFCPPLDEFRGIAQRAVMAHFIGVAMQDQRPDTQRAMDAVKAAEARLMLMPGSNYVSDLIREEAEIRSRFSDQPISPEQLARMIDAEATKLKKIELARVEITVGIEAASDVASIAAILTQFDIPIPVLNS